MSTPDNKPAKQSNVDGSAQTPSEATSERARAIARRSFLRRSVGVAAPVVMTLQSGPALAVQSITCQQKSANIDVNDPKNNPSGFTNSPLTAIDDRLLSGTASSTVKTIDIHPENLTASRVGAGDDNIVRCVDTQLGDLSDPLNNSNSDFTADPPPTPPASQTWTFKGSDRIMPWGLAPAPTGNYPPHPRNTGPIALFTINGDGEDTFVGCFGDANADLFPADAFPLNGSCWSSLHPGTTINPNP